MPRAEKDKVSLRTGLKCDTDVRIITGDFFFNVWEYITSSNGKSKQRARTVR